MQDSFSMFNVLNFSNSGARNVSILALAIAENDSAYHPTVKLKFGQGLRLTTLKLEYISLARFDVRMDRLTHVYLSWLPIVDFMDLLARAPTMIALSVHGFESAE
jgi:hypothetical protein